MPPDFPEDPRLSDESNLTAPEILPLSDLLAETAEVRDPTNPDPGLQARGEDLRRRADAVRATSAEGL